MSIKALACELPATRNLPLSRFSVADIAREARRTGLVSAISDCTVWRWLNEDAIRPGSIVAGFSLVILNLLQKLVVFSTFTKGFGIRNV